MIRCVLSRSSRTANWLTTLSRSYTATTISTEQENGSSNSSATPAELVASADGISEGSNLNNGAGRSEDAQGGRMPPSKPSKLYVPRQLPISPLMDPKAMAAREKHKLPKLPPSKTPTLFQEQLAKNPYAQALATPVRQCQVTNTRLPKYFLQDFELMAHPDTREPWWVPTSLRKKRQDVGAMAGEKEAGSCVSNPDSELPSQAQIFNGDMKAINTNDPVSAELEPPSSSPPEARSSPSPSLGPGVHTLSRQALLLSMQRPQSGWNFPAWKYFSNGDFKGSAIARKVRDRASWRADMDTFVLELHRRRVVEGLVYLIQRKRGYVAGCVDWEDAKMAGRQQGVILWTGNKSNEVGEEHMGAEDEEESTAHYSGLGGPPAFATLTIGKNKPHMVPVHNLAMLLGPNHLEDLMRKCPIFNREVLIVRDRKVTVDLQMKLWKLQGYLAFPEIHDGIQKGRS